MTTAHIAPSAPSELALDYFTAILTRDFTTLTTKFKISLDECKLIGLDAQNMAASKLMAAGNILNRKAPVTRAALQANGITPPPATVTPPAPAASAPVATFQTFAGASSKYAPPKNAYASYGERSLTLFHVGYALRETAIS